MPDWNRLGPELEQGGPGGERDHRKNGREENHLAGEGFIDLIFLRKHGHCHRCRHGHFQRYDHQRHGTNVKKSEDHQADGRNDHQTQSSIEKNGRFKKILYGNIRKNDPDHEHDQYGIAAADGSDDFVEHSGQNPSETLSSHHQNSRENGDHAWIGQGFLQKRRKAYGAFRIVEHQSIGPHHNAKGNGINRRIQSAFLPESGLADDKSKRPRIIGYRTVFKIQTLSRIGYAFPDPSRQKDEQNLAEDRNDQNGKGRLQNFCRQRGLKRMKNGAGKNQIHDQGIDLRRTRSGNDLSLSQKIPDQQKGKKLDLKLNHKTSRSSAKRRVTSLLLRIGIKKMNGLESKK